MKFTHLFTIVSALSVVSAAPAGAPDTTTRSNSAEVVFKRDCPSYFASTGSCNGTSCMWGLVNYDCDFGSCVGEGGGDGSCCGWPSQGGGSHCPNGGW